MVKKKFLKKAVIAAAIVSAALIVPVSGSNSVLGSAMNGLTTCYAEEDDTVGGMCGRNVSYTLYKTTGDLVISGSGKIYDDPSFHGTQYLEYIKNVIIEDGVTGIGGRAFQNCSNLSSITLPEGLTGIGSAAFDGCSNLTSIILPEGLTSIGESAFFDCSSLTNIILPGDLTSIGNNAFQGCSNLTGITLPGSLTSIGHCAFANCSSLSSITLPEGLTSIELEVFSGCSSLSSIILPESLTSIGNRAFSGCSNLSNITIPEGVTDIGSYAFSGCSSLSNITIPEGVTDIGSYAFSGCSNLSNITIPEGVTDIGSYAFSGCSSLSSITIPEGVTNIEEDAFKDCDSLTIYGHAGSCAEIYADSKSIKFVDPSLQCTVTFYDGELIEEQTVYYGESATVPVLTALQCYTLSWDKAFDKVTEDIEVHAVWTEAHQWESEWTIDQEPTATEEGSKSHHCTVCNEKTDITVIPKKESFTGMMTEENGAKYWYENGIKQGTEGRGKEIYDPETDAWYWLDAIDGGKVATGKDVYQESNGGKWVRYDENGGMIKGWDTTEAGQYYFDLITGAMTKGAAEVGGTGYSFDDITGILLGKADKIFITKEENRYWYEDGIRQGTEGRGKEIYDPETDAWYWLDAIDGGKVATSKDVYQESWAGQYADNEDGTGKWVRYDKNGYMIKGWNEQRGNRYYFDPVTGAMAKGYAQIDGVQYYFDQNTGVLQQEKDDEDRIDHDALTKPSQDEEVNDNPEDDDIDEPVQDEEVNDNPEEDDIDEPNQDEEVNDNPEEDNVDKPNPDEEVNNNPEEDDIDEPVQDEEVNDNPEEDDVDEPNQDEEVNDNPEQGDGNESDDNGNSSEEHPDPDGPGWSIWVK